MTIGRCHMGCGDQYVTGDCVHGARKWEIFYRRYRKIKMKIGYRIGLYFSCRESAEAIHMVLLSDICKLYVLMQYFIL